MSGDLKVVFEDEQILVVDKPAGLVVNRAETVKGPTLQDELFDYFKASLPKGSDPNIGGRAGIVHRLDRETSGLLLVAKTQKAFDFLQAQFKAREVKKEYTALVHGLIKGETGTIESRLTRIKLGKFGIADRRSAEGREARTDFKVASYLQHNFFRGPTPLGVEPLKLTRARIRYLQIHAKSYTLLSVFPKTGRTHQLRVHLKSIGHPVVSDRLYAPRKLLAFDLSWCPRLFLHAQLLEFKHPKTSKAVKFTSPLPKELEEVLSFLTRSIITQGHPEFRRRIDN